MRIFFILLRKEMKSFFYSPLAYIVMALLMLLNGVPFVLSLVAMRGGERGHSLVYLSFNSIWFWLSYLLLFPLITMRLFAEEKKLGTIETLLTAPVRTSQVVLSKFAATLIFYCFLWLPTVGNFLVFEWIAGESAAYSSGAFLGSYLILFLMGAFYVAIGCLASAMTSNQIVAAFLALTAVLLHFFTGFLHLFSSRIPAAVSERVTYLSSFEHMKTFSSGLVDSRALVYYLSFAALLLVLTHRVLDYRKWKV